MNSHFCVGQTLNGIGVRNIFFAIWGCYLSLLGDCGTASIYILLVIGACDASDALGLGRKIEQS